jgi:hypothetical protein
MAATTTAVGSATTPQLLGDQGGCYSAGGGNLHDGAHVGTGICSTTIATAVLSLTDVIYKLKGKVPFDYN